MRGFENRALSRILNLQVTEGLRKLHNEALVNIVKHHCVP
jgi:hypothetical protein